MGYLFNFKTILKLILDAHVLESAYMLQHMSRDQKTLAGAGSLLPCGFPGSNSGCWAWQQARLPLSHLAGPAKAISINLLINILGKLIVGLSFLNDIVVMISVTFGSRNKLASLHCALSPSSRSVNNFLMTGPKVRSL